MSTLDLVMSFWQVPLTVESCKYTAFLFEGICYEFRVTPFDLKTSTAALVRGLDFALRGIEDFVLNFIDDVLCLSRNIDQHFEHLNVLFQRLEDHNLTVNFEKSQFFREEIKFLAYILTPLGINLIQRKLKL